MDPASPAGATVLATHFISQSALDIQRKLKKAEEDPQTPISDLVKMAFKVFNSREEAAELKRQARLQQKVQLQTQALVAALRPAGSGSQQRGETNRTPSGGLFQMQGRGTLGSPVPQSKAANSALPSMPFDGPLEIRLP